MERRHAALAMRWVILLLGLLLAAWTLVDHKSARCDRDVSTTGTTARTRPRPRVAMVRASAGPDLGGHGARPSQLVAAAARTATIDDDPWASPEDALADPWQPNTPPAPVRHIVRLVTTAQGELSQRREPLPQGERETRELSAYDVTALITRGGACAAPLRGCEISHDARLGLPAVPYEPDAGRGRTGLCLLSALVNATGVETWTTNHTWLGFDEERSLLWLRNTARVAATVEQVLDRWAQQAAAVWRVHARIDGEGMPGLDLHLDVMWAGAARAFTGTRSIFLLDYDIEVGHGTTTTLPIWDVLEGGVGLRAQHLAPSGRGPGRIVLDIFDACGTPVLRTFDVTGYHFGPLILEDLALPAHHQQAALAADEDWRVGFDLSDGRRCTIAVQRVDGPITPWKRLRTPRTRHTPPPAYTFELRGNRSGLLGKDHAGLGVGRLHGHARLRTDSPMWTRKRAGGREPPDAPLNSDEPIRCGGIGVKIMALDATDAPSRLDLVLDLGSWSGESRTIRRRMGDHERGSGWTESELPTADAVVVSRRLLLDRHGTGAMAFQGDIGLGPERFTLRVWRRDSGRAPPSTR